jgi:Ca2+-binding EF-hand superfamily protein
VSTPGNFTLRFTPKTQEFIMSTISSISGSSLASSYATTTSTQKRHRPDPSEMAADLFSKLDTTSKGYIDQSDLTAALSSASSSTSSSSSSASDIFSQLDSDGDGKVTKDELTSSMQKLADELDSQFNQARMDGAMPPPPPPDSNSSDTGFTKDELNAQLSEIGSSDTARAGLISNIVQNFEKADTDGDGKVSFKEAQAYDQSSNASSTSGTASASSTTPSADSSTLTSDAKLYRQLMDILRTYGESSSTLSALSAAASKISTTA